MTDENPRRKTPVFLLVGLGLLILAGLAYFLITQQQEKQVANAQSTATQSLLNTAAAEIAGTQAAESTHQSQQTATREANRAATAVIDATATQHQVDADALWEELTAETPDYQNRENIVFHHQDDGIIHCEWSSVYAANTAIEMEFFIPFNGPTTHRWSVGLVFRYLNNDVYNQLILLHKAYFEYEHWGFTSRQFRDTRPEDTGLISNDLFFSYPEDNKASLKLLILNDVAYFWLNDQLISQLDVAERIDQGESAACVGFKRGDEVEGDRTTVTRFAVWNLD